MRSTRFGRESFKTSPWIQLTPSRQRIQKLPPPQVAADFPADLSGSLPLLRTLRTKVSFWLPLQSVAAQPRRQLLRTSKMVVAK
jgi:hypothetical protein